MFWPPEIKVHSIDIDLQKISMKGESLRKNFEINDHCS
jgi:hypothetical protein